MNKTTRLWNNIAEELVTEEQDPEFINDVYEKFGEIFDIKDVTEYKNCALVTPFFAPSQFSYMSLAIRRAFVEGYLLSMAEQKKERIKFLFNCYKDDKETITYEKKTITKRRHTPRTINDYLAKQSPDMGPPESDDD
jgi:hypothetical protein